MLSQVIVRSAMGWSEKGANAMIPLGAVVFVVCSRGHRSQVLYKENLYTVASSTLEPLANETEILSPTQIVKRNKIRSEETREEVENALLNLKFE